MPYKDPEDRKNYEREYRRRERSSYNDEGCTNPDELQTIELKSTDDLRSILERITNEVINSNIDVVVKARTVVQLLKLALDIVRFKHDPHKIREHSEEATLAIAEKIRKLKEMNEAQAKRNLLRQWKKDEKEMDNARTAGEL